MTRRARLRAFVKRLARFARALWSDAETPRWARWALGLSMLPTPFELDEVVRAVVLAVLWVRHRPLLRRCWAASVLPLAVVAVPQTAVPRMAD